MEALFATIEGVLILANELGSRSDSWIRRAYIQERTRWTFVNHQPDRSHSACFGVEQARRMGSEDTMVFCQLVDGPLPPPAQRVQRRRGYSEGPLRSAKQTECFIESGGNPEFNKKTLTYAIK